MDSIRSQLFVVLLWKVAIFVALPAGSVYADGYRQGFDDTTPNWIVRADESQVRVVNHGGQADVRIDGERAEALEVESTVQPGTLQLEHELPPAVSIDDLKLQLWLKAEYPGAGLWLRIVFPYETDPATDKPLTSFLRGESYTKSGNWQKLTAGITTKMLQERARQLRASLRNPHLDFRDAYIDRAILTCKVPKGKSTFVIDALEFGPIVSPTAVDAKPKSDVQQTTLTTTKPGEAEIGVATSKPTTKTVEFQLDRLLVSGRPFFPRIAAHHGEPFDSLKLAGLNVVWVQDYENTDVLAALRKEGLWAMATPPRATDPAGKIIDPEDVSIIPFPEATQPILLWNLGTSVPMEARNDLIGWMKQIRGADRTYRRPVMVDIQGGQEKIVSRHVPMLGVSQHFNHTTLSPKTFRQWLSQKKKLARPGTFLWTWIQTEYSSSVNPFKERVTGSPIVIEPEQIRLQVYSALAAGCRGLGFWKSNSLEANAPGAYERQLAIAQLNLELELLEPFLATGTVVDHIPFGAVPPSPRRIGRRDIDFRNTLPEAGERQALLNERKNQVKRAAHLAGDLEATIIRNDYGTLLLPIWYDREAQFVPGQMAANDASIVVPPFDRSASAWEISPTGIRSLKHVRTAGGKQIILKKFDQTAAVIVTSDRELIAQLREKVKTLAEPSARVSVALAKAKLERVSQIDSELQTLGVSQPDAPQILAKSRQLVTYAEESLRRGDYHNARLMAADAMQLQRILQRTHWNDAIRKLTSPVSSPHTLCFQTLPDHWRMITRLGDSRMDNNNNLLRSGDFEDIDTMVVERWQHSQQDYPGIHAAAELYPEAKEGNYSLRMVASPLAGQPLPAVLPVHPVTVTTPAVTVQSGQVVSISGWVRVTSPISQSLQGAMLYDNLGGADAALRWQAASDWQRFSMLREVRQSGPFQLTMALTGLGEIQFDDLKIIPHDPRTMPVVAPPPVAEDSKNPFTTPLRLLQNLPNFRPWQTRN